MQSSVSSDSSGVETPETSVWHPRHVLNAAAAMLGLRLDRSRWQALVMVAGIAISAVLGFGLTDTHLANILGTTTHRAQMVPALLYTLGMWCIYYFGHTVFYKLGLHRVMRRRLGEERAYTVYSSVLGVVFFNLALCQVPFLSAFGGSLTLPGTSLQIMLLSAVMFAVSLGVKFWATLVLGVDGYYYRDMFLEKRSEGGPLTGGPYAFLSDPMYSVGYLLVYSTAIYAQSLEGLVVAIVFHLSIIAFNWIVEQPFVKAMYGTP
jgi:hypothetical protein